MQRRVFLLLAVIVCVPAIAQAAITLTVGNHMMKAGETLTFDIMLTNAGNQKFNSSDMRTTIESGGPVVTKVFNTVAGAALLADYSSSVWAGGLVGVGGGVDGTSPGATGQRTTGGFATSGFADVTTGSGTYATITVDSTGVAVGVYDFTLDGHEDGFTEMFSADIGFIDDLVLINGTIEIVPEPGSIVLGLFAVAGLATVAIRRHRGRRAA